MSGSSVHDASTEGSADEGERKQARDEQAQADEQQDRPDERQDQPEAGAHDGSDGSDGSDESDERGDGSTGDGSGEESGSKGSAVLDSSREKRKGDGEAGDTFSADKAVESAREHQSDKAGVDASELSVEELEEERQRRLDPDNRPDNVEVDNTQRDFDVTTGQFRDEEPDPDLGPFVDPEAPDDVQKEQEEVGEQHMEENREAADRGEAPEGGDSGSDDSGSSGDGGDSGSRDDEKGDGS